MTAAADQGETALPPPLERERAPQPRRRRLLICAAALLAVWIAALMTLALTSANPPVLNLRQLALARHLVVVRVEDRNTGRCRVLDRYTPGEVPEIITVSNLSQTSALAGGAYILPLVRDAVLREGGYRIVDDPSHNLAPLIYPHAPALERQVRAWQNPLP